MRGMDSGPVLDGRHLTTLRLPGLADHAFSVVYGELLEPSFPAAELVTYEELDDARHAGDCDGLVLLDGATPIAAMVTEEYVGGRVRLLAYLVVADRARGKRLGEHLLHALAGPPTPELVLAEVEDPRFHGRKGTSDPVGRLRLYERTGSRLLPLDYFQPSLRPGSPRVGNLLLLTVHPTSGKLDAQLVLQFLDEYFVACEGDKVLSDEEFLSLRRAAEGGAGGLLGLSPLTELGVARAMVRC